MLLDQVLKLGSCEAMSSFDLQHYDTTTSYMSDASDSGVTVLDFHFNDATSAQVMIMNSPPQAKPRNTLRKYCNATPVSIKSEQHTQRDTFFVNSLRPNQHHNCSLKRQHFVSTDSRPLMSIHNASLNKSSTTKDRRTESHKRTQPTNKDNTNDNLSDDDTEDSTDNNKPDKPKPGKLDLSQYNNITNAIGKLNVQPTSNKPVVAELSAIAQSKLQQASPVSSSQEKSGFFKSRTRKVKNQHPEDTPKQEIVNRDGREQPEGLVHSKVDKKILEVRSKSDKPVRGSSVSESSDSPHKTGIAPRKARELEQATASNSSRQKLSSQNIRNTPHIPPQSPRTAIDPTSFNDFSDSPKPAPRTTQATAGSSIVRSAPVSSFASSSDLSKRVANNRRNHGKAVAPPQLPGFSASLDVDESLANKSLDEVDPDIDYNQSPMAQRLIRCLKDHKVSELNSPPESDSELPQSTLQIRQKFHRDHQNLGTENNSPSSLFLNSSIDSSELINSRGAAIRQLNEILANKQPIGRFGMLDATRTPSLEQEHLPVALPAADTQHNTKKSDKDSKREKKKLRDDEKLEKRRIKEEERLRRQEKKQAGKKSKLTSPVADKTVDDDGIPFFIKRCIEFIESEGMDAEGIYRVPGNRAHVDTFVQKLQENPDMSIVESDVPVNAVATSLKDFLSKKWSPIIPLALMNELTELSNIPDKEQRVAGVKQLVQRLPPANYRLLKYVFAHFVKISLNHTLNSMDSKNLAICWWPTLLPLHFSDMVMFEQMRPHLEESIQTMIDQYDYIFDSE